MRPEPPTLSIEARRILLSRVWDLLLQPLADQDHATEVSDSDGSETGAASSDERDDVLRS